MSDMSLADELVKVLNEVDPETGLTYRDQIMQAVRQKAKGGDPEFVKLLERAQRKRAHGDAQGEP
jgi:hypothetical protein